MPWICPKCCVHIGNDKTPLPIVGMVYRCPVCKLAITFDPTIGKMKPVNVPNDPKPGKPNAA